MKSALPSLSEEEGSGVCFKYYEEHRPLHSHQQATDSFHDGIEAAEPNAASISHAFNTCGTSGIAFADNKLQRARKGSHINTALFQPAFVISARSEWCYPCYNCFYLRMAYDGHCELSLQIELRKVGIGTGNWLGRSA
jgi:hypothetical protein